MLQTLCFQGCHTWYGQNNVISTLFKGLQIFKFCSPQKISRCSIYPQNGFEHLLLHTWYDQSMIHQFWRLVLGLISLQPHRKISLISQFARCYDKWTSSWNFLNLFLKVVGSVGWDSWRYTWLGTGAFSLYRRLLLPLRLSPFIASL